MKSKKISTTGNGAATFALKQINPAVFPAFPITPSTTIAETVSKLISDGKMDTKFISVESEHSAMSAAIGASLGGSFPASATSSNGLMYMAEMLAIASGMRAPMLLEVVTRAISSPLNIHCDHSDVMTLKDTGWIIMFCSDNQQVYDNTLIAAKLSKDKDIFLPVMVCQDGFLTSHNSENMEVIQDDNEVRKFIGEYENPYSLLKQNVTVGYMDLPNSLFGHKKEQMDALGKVEEVLEKIDHEYYKLTKRKYEAVETYNMEDAQIAIFAAGSICNSAKALADKLKEEGINLGVISLRLFRPFPKEEFARKTKNLKKLIVLDRMLPYSLLGGELFTHAQVSIMQSKETQNKDNIQIVDYIYGIGGQDTTLKQLEDIVRFQLANKEQVQDIQYIYDENNKGEF